jgi:hypothetical protein
VAGEPMKSGNFIKEAEPNDFKNSSDQLFVIFSIAF